MFTEVEYTIQSGTHGDTAGVVMSSTECAEHLALNIFHHSRIGVIDLLCIPEEHVHAIGYTRGDVDVFQEGEVRKTDLEVVVHTVLELVPESRLVELRCLETDSVLERCAVTEREFLIPFLLTDSLLLLKRIESCYRESYIRQCERV